MCVALTVAMLAMLAVVAESASPAAAQAAPPRMCPGDQIGGMFSGADGEAHLHPTIWVPSGANLHLHGILRITSPDDTGGWQSILYPDPVSGWLYGLYYAGPAKYPVDQYWHNDGASRDITLDIRQEFGNWVRYSIAFYVEGGDGSVGVDCGLKAGSPSVYEMLGPNPSEPNSCCHSLAGDPIDTETGNFHEGQVDLAVAGRGLGLAFGRSYNSLVAGTDGPLGLGWTSNYLMSLSVDSTGVATIHQESGALVRFSPDGGGGFTAAARVTATLAHDGVAHRYTFHRSNGDVFHFDDSGRLVDEADRNGETTTLAYDGSGHLSTVTDPAGRSLTIGWTGSHITSVTDSASPPRTVAYSYNGSGQLESVTDVAGGVWQLGYGAFLETIRDPAQTAAGGPGVTNLYDGMGRVVSQTDALGRTTQLDYMTIPGATMVTDPKGNVAVSSYTDGFLSQVTRGYGTPSAATSQMEYDPATLGRTKVTDPNGHVTIATYDTAGNRTSVTDGLGSPTLGITRGHRRTTPTGSR